MLFVICGCCLLFVVCLLFSVVCLLIGVACCLSFFGGLLLVCLWCLLCAELVRFGCWSFVMCGLLVVVCGSLFDTRCLLFVVCCGLHFVVFFLYVCYLFDV